MRLNASVAAATGDGVVGFAGDLGTAGSKMPRLLTRISMSRSGRGSGTAVLAQ
jgi:hypothetical protein